MITNLVSILVPAYNAEKLLAQTLNSAVEQTWPHKEILVIDDGSTDNTFEVALQFAGSNVKVVRQTNAGACATRNRLFSLAQGEYIQWLDADDLLAPDKISNQMRRRDGGGESQTLLTAAWGSFFYRPHNAKFVPSGLWHDLTPLDWIMTKFTENTWMNPTVWLVSRRLSEDAGPWDTRLTTSGDDDGEYILRVVAAAREVRFVPDAVCYYRIGVSGSLNWDMGADRRKLEALCKSLELSIEHCLRLKDTPESRKSCLLYLNVMINEFYGADNELIDRLQSCARRLGGEVDRPAAAKKYSLFEKALGTASTAKIMRRWRQTKLFASGRMDHLLWKLSTEQPSQRHPASLA